MNDVLQTQQLNINCREALIYNNRPDRYIISPDLNLTWSQRWADMTRRRWTIMETRDGLWAKMLNYRFSLSGCDSPENTFSTVLVETPPVKQRFVLRDDRADISQTDGWEQSLPLSRGMSAALISSQELQSFVTTAGTTTNCGFKFTVLSYRAKMCPTTSELYESASHMNTHIITPTRSSL